MSAAAAAAAAAGAAASASASSVALTKAQKRAELERKGNAIFQTNGPTIALGHEATLSPGFAFLVAARTLASENSLSHIKFKPAPAVVPKPKAPAKSLSSTGSSSTQQQQMQQQQQRKPPPMNLEIPLPFDMPGESGAIGVGDIIAKMTAKQPHMSPIPQDFIASVLSDKTKLNGGPSPKLENGDAHTSRPVRPGASAKATPSAATPAAATPATRPTPQPTPQPNVPAAVIADGHASGEESESDQDNEILEFLERQKQNARGKRASVPPAAAPRPAASVAATPAATPAAASIAATPAAAASATPATPASADGPSKSVVSVSSAAQASGASTPKSEEGSAPRRSSRRLSSSTQGSPAVERPVLTMAAAAAPIPTLSFDPPAPSEGTPVGTVAPDPPAPAPADVKEKRAVVHNPKDWPQKCEVPCDMVVKLKVKRKERASKAEAPAPAPDVPVAKKERLDAPVTPAAGKAAAEQQGKKAVPPKSSPTAPKSSPTTAGEKKAQTPAAAPVAPSPATPRTGADDSQDGTPASAATGMDVAEDATAPAGTAPAAAAAAAAATVAKKRPRTPSPEPPEHKPAAAAAAAAAARPAAAQRERATTPEDPRSEKKARTSPSPQREGKNPEAGAGAKRDAATTKQAVSKGKEARVKDEGDVKDKDDKKRGDKASDRDKAGDKDKNPEKRPASSSDARRPRKLDLSRTADEYTSEGRDIKHAGDTCKGFERGLRYCRSVLEYMKAICVMETERRADKRRSELGRKIQSLCESTRDFAKRQTSPGGALDMGSNDPNIIALASIMMKCEAMLDNNLYHSKFDTARQLQKTLYQEYRLLEHSGIFSDDPQAAAGAAAAGAAGTASSPKEKVKVSVDRDLLTNTLAYLKINELQVKGNDRWYQSKSLAHLPHAIFDKATEAVGKISFSSSSLEDVIKFATYVLDNLTPKAAEPAAAAASSDREKR